ncbi:hypothetical protein [Streptomyces luteireticuli]|uniref:DUF4242 domain-containing protein n=1 Tax=Streptomyces luteireticuli TaxID=173858 RepID=A0ABP3I5W8_9ACTN
MTLKFLGIIPNTPANESPTMWLHMETGDVLCQSYKATEEEIKECQEIGSIPGHSNEVPDHETITASRRSCFSSSPDPTAKMKMRTAVPTTLEEE